MFGKRTQNEKPPTTPETLEVYKTTAGYKWKQSVKKWSPKKKLMLIALPLLVIVAGLAWYFIFAAPPEATFKLQWTRGGTINGASYSCGETNKQMDIVVEQESSNIQDIVSVASFINFDPNLIEVTEIDVRNTDFSTGEGNTTPTSGGSMQRIDNTAGTIEITRGEPVGTTGHAFNAATGTLATIHFNIKTNVESSGGNLFWFNTAQDRVVLRGGAAETPRHEGSGVYTGTIVCCIAPHDTCLSYEACPSDNWYNTTIRCCNETCVEGIEFYLFEREQTLDIGEEFVINVNIRPDYQPLGQINVRLNLNNTSGLGGPAALINNLRIEPAGGVSFSTAPDIAVDRSSVSFAINGYTTTGKNAATLATLRFTGTAPGTVSITFDAGNTNANLASGAAIMSSYTGGTYTIVRQRVKLCNGTDALPRVGSNYADFGVCTTPNAACSLTLTPAGGAVTLAPQPPTEAREHEIKVSNLQNGTTYNYTLTCTKNDYESLVINKQFTTLTVANLTIDNVAVNNIKASRATINWNTTGGQNGDGKADSFVCYRPVGGTNFKGRGEAVNVHSIELTGLTAGTAYEFVATSDVSGRPAGSNPCVDLTACAGATSETCAVSAPGTFTTVASTASADANLIVKVTKDRICDEWLYCDVRTTILNTSVNPPKDQDVCFKVGTCNKLDVNNQCIGIVNQDARAEVTAESPAKIATLRDYSGYTKAGATWGYRCLNSGNSCNPTVSNQCGSGVNAKCVSAEIKGYYPYGAMREVGIPIVINNGNLESGSKWPWKEHNNATIENSSVDNIGHELKIIPSADNYSGAKVEDITTKVLDATSITSNSGLRYIVSFRARSDSAGERPILAELLIRDSQSDNSQYANFKMGTNTKISIGSTAKEYIVSISADEFRSALTQLGTVQGQIKLDLLLVNGDKNNRAAFYIDNVSMKAVLDVGGEGGYISRSCRLYPTESAPACDYYDPDAKKNYSGWKGYCAETDPAYQKREYVNQPMCLLWWPVDIINGESNIFSKDSVAAGYTGRVPLYYCLEAAGNYARGVSSGTSVSDKYSVMTYHAFPEEDGCDKDTRANGEDRNKYTFYFCKGIWFNASNNRLGDTIISLNSNDNELGLKEYEIAYIYLERIIGEGNAPKDVYIYPAKFGTTEEFGGATYKYDRVVDNSAGEITWKFWPTQEKEGYDAVRASFVFNKVTGLKYLYVDGRDNTGADSDDQEGTAYVIHYYLREPCLKIAQVVDPAGNTQARIARLRSETITSVAPASWLGYTKDQDYSPYGSSLVPTPVDDPKQWDVLYVQPPDTTAGLNQPYQVRAGSPYGVTVGRKVNPGVPLDRGTCINAAVDATESPVGKCAPAWPDRFWCANAGDFAGNVYSARDEYCRLTYNMERPRCYRGVTGQNFYCVETVSEGVFPDVYNPCEICITGAADPNNPTCNCTMSSVGVGDLSSSGNKYFGQPVCISGAVGKECSNGSQDCYSENGYGECVGFNKPTIKTWGQFNTLVENTSGRDQLKELFAKAYGVWNWEYDTNEGKWKYREAPSEKWDATSSGQPPQITFLWAGNNGNTSNDVILTKQGSVYLKFGSYVNVDQRPLVRYTVDWGDGNQTTEAGLKIEGRDTTNPHILVHNYQYKDSCNVGTTGLNAYCEFTPKVQIEDNWGLCNGTGECMQNTAWESFGGKIIVYKEQGQANLAPVLTVGPLNLRYYYGLVNGTNFTLPYTLNFTVRNDGLSAAGTTPTPMQWQIGNISGFLSAYNFLARNTTGVYESANGSANLSPQSGTLYPGESTTVSLTLNSISSLTKPAATAPAVSYTARIPIENVTGGAGSVVTRDVVVNLVVGN